MEKRTLGGSLEVSAIGLGCMTMNTNLFGTPSGAETT
jgi:aryl-alcohol dehydrogenase-like predicted oxidoreductase